MKKSSTLSKIHDILHKSYEVEWEDKDTLLVKFDTQIALKIIHTKKFPDTVLISISVECTDAHIVALIIETLFYACKIEIIAPFYNSSAGNVYGQDAYVRYELEQNKELLMQMGSPSEYKN